MASRICMILAIIAVSCTGVDGALSWGTWLGADWRRGEGKNEESGKTELHSASMHCERSRELFSGCQHVLLALAHNIVALAPY